MRSLMQASGNLGNNIHAHTHTHTHIILFRSIDEIKGEKKHKASIVVKVWIDL